MSKEKQIELKPCPFCGHDVIESRIVPDRYMPAIIYCNRCGANSYSINTEAAIEKWNTRYFDRVANIAAPSMFECSGCRWECFDEFYNESEFKFCPNCGKSVLDRGYYPLFSTFCDNFPPKKREKIGEENLIAMYVAMLDPDAEDKS